MAQRYRLMGTIERTHGTKGEMLFVPLRHGAELREGLRVALVPPTLEDDRFQTVASTTPAAGGSYVRFRGVGDMGAAERCVGRSVLLSEADAEGLAGARFHSGPLEREDVRGWAVEDAKLGHLGCVARLEEGAVQDLIVVEGTFGEVLIPAVEPIVRDADAGTIFVDCPPGLTELSKGGGDPT